MKMNKQMYRQIKILRVYFNFGLNSFFKYLFSNFFNSFEKFYFKDYENSTLILKIKHFFPFQN